MYFKRSGLNAKLKYTLKQGVPRRWNSTCHMLNSVFTSYEEIVQLLKNKPETDKIQSVDIHMLKAVLELLYPFDKATIALSYGEKPTILCWTPKISQIQKLISDNETYLPHHTCELLLMIPVTF